MMFCCRSLSWVYGTGVRQSVVLLAIAVSTLSFDHHNRERLIGNTSSKIRARHSSFTPRKSAWPCSSTQRRLSVPFLFRQTLISTAKRHKPARTEIPAQRHGRRSRDRGQKFELYSDL